MFDLLAVAYQADLTRVFTFMMAREASQRTYPGLGMSETHHDMSHHGGQPDEDGAAREDQHATSRRCSRRSSSKLRATPDGDGSVLDHSLIVYGTGMSDGQAHDSYPLPFALVGGAGGRIARQPLSSSRRSGRRSRISGSASPTCSAARSSSFGESTARFEI